MTTKNLYNYRRKAITAAKELWYSEDIERALKKATTEREIDSILTNARKGNGVLA